MNSVKLKWVDMEIVRIKIDPKDRMFDFETKASSVSSCGSHETAKDTLAQGGCGSCSRGCH